MSLWQARRLAYRTGRTLGDVEAVERSLETGSVLPVVRRAERRLLWRLAWKVIRGLSR